MSSPSVPDSPGPLPAGRGGERRRKAPLAVVGSQVSWEEEMVAEAFDGVILRRFWGFISPYRRALLWGVVGVMVFTLSQVMIPLLLRFAVDDALVVGDLALLRVIALAFLGVVVVNYVSNFLQEWMANHLGVKLK